MLKCYRDKDQKQGKDARRNARYADNTTSTGTVERKKDKNQGKWYTRGESEEVCWVVVVVVVLMMVVIAIVRRVSCGVSYRPLEAGSKP